jgi:hypothetical protein
MPASEGIYLRPESGFLLRLQDSSLQNMERTFDEFPDWTFDLIEISVGVFRMKARDAKGRSFEKTGTNPHALLEEGKNYARRF